MNTQILVSVLVHADKQKVWDYYTFSQHITQWNYAIDTWHCPSASNDLREGGKYTARMEAKDGSFGFDVEGVYTEIIFGERFAYLMPDKRMVQVTFYARENNQTEVSIIFDAENENPIDMQKQGWQAILNNFKNYTETH